MEVRALKLFRDKKEDVARKKGDIFTVTKERFDELNLTQFGDLVEEVKEGESSKKKPNKK